MSPFRLLSPLVALTGAVLAQSPQPAGQLQPALPAAADMRVPVHTHPADPSYGTWAAGDTYKASFDGGMTFYPALGKGYPHNQPFGWTTASVKVGEQELLEPGRRPAMTHGDFRVEYAHGAVTEAYDVRGEGLEQSFVFAQRPAASGDLVITGALHSGLFVEPTPPAVTDLLFADANGNPILRYGKAVAVDANGDTFAVTTACADGRVTLRLAAADVARAAFPLVVDPLVAAQAEYYTGIATDLGDVAAASAGGGSINSLLMFTRFYSATDTDVSILMGNAALGQMVLCFSDLSASTAADHLRASYVAGTNRWLAVYQSLTLSSQVMQLQAVMLDWGVQTVTVATQPHFVVAGTHEWRPEVGGVIAGSSTEALVVYQQETGTTAFANTATSKVMGVRIDTTGNFPTWGSAFQVYGSASEDAERPSVNRMAEGGAAFSWFVVSQVYNNTISGDDWDLIGKRVDNTGAVAGQWVSSLGTVHKLGPVVDGRAGRYCVGYGTAGTSVGKVQDVLGTAICAERVDMPHGAASQTTAGDWPVQTLQSNQFRILEANTIAFDGLSRSHWQMGWRSSSTVPAIYTARLGYRGASIYGNELVAATGTSVPGVLTATFNDNNRASSTAFMTRTAAGACWLMRRIVTLPTLAGAPIQTFGCSPGATGWFGPSTRAEENQSIGGDLSGVRTISTPPGSLHLLVVGLSSTNFPVVDPAVGVGCTLLVPISGAGYLGTLPLAIGSNVEWPIALPEYLPAIDFYFQDWVYDTYNNVLRNTGSLQVSVTK
jgi:hypothetical protein